MNRDEVIRRLQEIGQQHGDKPLTENVIRDCGLSPYWTTKHFRTLGSALKAAGLQPSKHSVSTATTKNDLLDYLDDLQRRLGRRPMIRDIATDGRFTARLFSIRFGSWKDALLQLKERQVPVEERPGLPEQSILIGEDLDVQSQSLADDVLRVVQKYEMVWKQRLQSAENRIGELEKENRNLSRALDDAEGLPPVKLLREILNTRYDEAELRDLCFELGVGYEELPSGGKTVKTRELIEYLQRRDRIQDLLDAVGKLRPDIQRELRARKF